MRVEAADGVDSLGFGARRVVPAKPLGLFPGSREKRAGMIRPLTPILPPAFWCRSVFKLPAWRHGSAIALTRFTKS